MLTFLRKIRKSLIESGSAQKYILYAIGEILLVMVGILLALQVNNWNEGKKFETKEIEMLNDFKTSLESDLMNLNRISGMGEKSKSAIEIILAHLEADLPYSDSLKFHFGLTTIGWVGQVNRSVFKSLESEGLALISNKELRQELIRLYDNLIIGKIERNNKYSDYLAEGSANILRTRFEEYGKGNYESWAEENDYSDVNFTTDGLIHEKTPIDYEKLKDDQEYHFFLKTLKNMRFWFVEIDNKSVKKAIISLLTNIELELEKIK